MSDQKKINPDLLKEIQRVLDPTGPHMHGPPNLTPIPGTEKEQHKPHKEKKAALGQMLSKALPEGSTIGKHFIRNDHRYDLAGLGMLMAPPTADLVEESQKPSGERSTGHMAKSLMELAGLGSIGAPVAAHMLMGKAAAATSLAKEKGFKRVGELLSGSRAKKLEEHGEHVAERGKRLHVLGALGKHHKILRDNAEEHGKEVKDVRHTRIGAGTALATIGAGTLAVKTKKKEASSFFDELQKLGAVSDEEAMRALQSLQDLEDNKPTTKQTLGYMGLGAVANPVMHMAGNAIRRRPLFEGASINDKLRDMAAQSLKGGVGGTAVSIGQQQLDRHHNMGKLRAYVGQDEKTAGVPPPLPAAAGGMAGALFGGMKSAPGVKVSPGYVRAPATRGLAGSGTPAMPMPKVAGFFDAVKSIALKDVGGPKGILQPAGQIASNAVPKAKAPGADFKAWQAKRQMKMAG